MNRRQITVIENKCSWVMCLLLVFDLITFVVGMELIQNNLDFGLYVLIVGIILFILQLLLTDIFMHSEVDPEVFYQKYGNRSHYFCGTCGERLQDWLIDPDRKLWQFYCPHCDHYSKTDEILGDAE
jgi:DNA-directed RNA polymerase subunit RPC12/RpoP